MKKTLEKTLRSMSREERNEAIGQLDSIVDEVDMGEGDIVRSFKRVIDVLRQFCTISNISEDLAFTAREAITVINRSPIDIDN